jgi:hypothetical protein
MSTTIYWAHILLLVPFLFLMSYNPIPTVMRLVAAGLLIFDLVWLFQWEIGSGTKNLESEPDRPFSVGQSKIEYSTRPNSKQLSFPNALYSQY